MAIKGSYSLKPHRKCQITTQVRFCQYYSICGIWSKLFKSFKRYWMKTIFWPQWKGINSTENWQKMLNKNHKQGNVNIILYVKSDQNLSFLSQDIEANHFLTAIMGSNSTENWRKMLNHNPKGGIVNMILMWKLVKTILILSGNHFLTTIKGSNLDENWRKMLTNNPKLDIVSIILYAKSNQNPCKILSRNQFLTEIKSSNCWKLMEMLTNNPKLDNVSIILYAKFDQLIPSQDIKWKLVLEVYWRLFPWTDTYVANHHLTLYLCV